MELFKTQAKDTFRAVSMILELLLWLWLLSILAPSVTKGQGLFAAESVADHCDMRVAPLVDAFGRKMNLLPKNKVRLSGPCLPAVALTEQSGRIPSNARIPFDPDDIANFQKLEPHQPFLPQKLAVHGQDPPCFRPGEESQNERADQSGREVADRKEALKTGLDRLDLGVGISGLCQPDQRHGSLLHHRENQHYKTSQVVWLMRNGP